MFSRKLFFVLLPVLLVTACKGKTSAPEVDFVADTVELAYAKGFSIEEFAGYDKVTVHNPWQPELRLAVYYLVEADSVTTPSDGMKIKVPVSSVAVSSVTQVGFLDVLGAIDKVTGSCSPELIYQPELRQKASNGQLVHLGDAFTINVERTMQLRPSVVVMSGYKQDDPYAERVQKAGIPVVYNNEWMEETVLGRAEWMKFMALLVGEEAKADSIFNSIATAYTDLCKLVPAGDKRPEVLVGSNFRGTWYMPGGDSYMARMLQDAGGNYFYANDSTKGSLPLNVESALKNFATADVWVNCNFESRSELIESDGKHALFGAVKTAKVYNFNKLLLPSGANDYWESAVARPDWLLKDLIYIMHPELLPGHTLRYYQQLK